MALNHEIERAVSYAKDCRQMTKAVETLNVLRENNSARAPNFVCVACDQSLGTLDDEEKLVHANECFFRRGYHRSLLEVLC